MEKQGKLELTWVGKEERQRLEPRILIEDPTKSYGDPKTENMLIFGDNLLALKALEQDFAGKIKCIYIDPPFNTQQAFEHYDDGLEHSLWLSMMRDRLALLHQLLSKDGAIAIHIDDNELGYLLILLDEIFNRKNKAFIATFRQGSATGHKTINPGCVNTSNYVVVYAKDKAYWKPKKLYTARVGRNKRYDQFITNLSDDYSEWKIIPLTKVFSEHHGMTNKDMKLKYENYDEILDEFAFENANAVVQLARPNYAGVSSAAREMIDYSKAHPQTVVMLKRDDHSDMYFIRGERIIFYKDTLKTIDGELVPGEPLTTIWDDLPSHNLHNEGGVEFPKGKKPEALIKRVIELFSEPGDWVLDSFGGSGTTGAVAHKMGYRWIMVELGEHCHTHILPRMKRVIDGEDHSGITKAVAWKGGGGFKYYHLAETLLMKDDDLGVYVINPKYNAEMLIRAICKIENFHYRINGRWHGYSSESRFIHITTKLLNQKYLDMLASELGDEQSLMVYSTKRAHSLKIPDNIEVKRIPKHLLEKCEFNGEVK